MKIVDKRCEDCKKVYEYMDNASKDKCKCGGRLLRLYSIKPEIFQVGYYENFDHDPIYIESKKQFQQECDKRDLVRVS